jgi:hypothetical protein
MIARGFRYTGPSKNSTTPAMKFINLPEDWQKRILDERAHCAPAQRTNFWRARARECLHLDGKADIDATLPNVRTPGFPSEPLIGKGRVHPFWLCVVSAAGSPAGSFQSAAYGQSKMC